MFNMCLKMPKRALGVLRNLQGHAIHHTWKTALQKMRRRQSIAIPIPQGRRTWTKHQYEFSIFFYLLMVNPKTSILRKGTHEQGPSKGWLVFWRNKDTRMWLDFPHSARILNVHLMLINVAAVGCSTTNPILSMSNQFCKSIVNAEDSWSKYSSNITVSSIHSKWFGDGQNFITA